MKKIYYIIILICLPLIGFNQIDSNLIFLSKAAEFNQNWIDAIDLYTQLITKEPNNVIYLKNRANCYKQTNEFVSAISDYKKANLLTPNCSDYELAECYALTNNAVEAIEYLRKYLTNDEKKTEAEIKTNKIFKDLKESNEWRNIWKKEYYTDIEKKISTINYLYNNEKFFNALEEIEKLLETNKKTAELFFIKAKIYIKLKDYYNAERNIDKALKLKNRNVSYLTLKAEIASLSEKYSDAILCYSKILQIDFSLLEIYKNRANQYFYAKEYNKAINDLIIYNKYISESATQTLLAECYLQNNQIENSIKLSNELLIKNPTDTNILIIRGRSYLNSGLYIFADNDFSKILDINPHFLDAYYYRGLSKLNQGNKAGACADWEIAKNKGAMKSHIIFEKNCN